VSRRSRLSAASLASAARWVEWVSIIAGSDSSLPTRDEMTMSAGLRSPKNSQA
jgi:hypothetical protein